MWSLVLAVWCAWILVAVLNHFWGSGNGSAAGLGLIVLPLALAVVSPVDSWFVVCSIVIGVVVLVLTHKNRHLGSKS